MRSDSLLLQAALSYARRGWAVIPLETPTFEPERPCSCGRPTCTDAGKHPRIRDWPNTASSDEEQVKRWWHDWPESNIGLLCGRRSGFFALDVDGPSGMESLRALVSEHGPLPEGPRQITGGGGRHFLFRWADGISNRVGFATGLDTRSEGGQIVAAPSIHSSGNEYRWGKNHHPDDRELPSAPEWLLSAIRGAIRSTPVDLPTDGPIEQGKRNDTLFRNGCSMRSRGFGAAAIRAALLEENRERCRPALDIDEVEEIARSISTYQPGANGVHLDEPPNKVVNVVLDLCRKPPAGPPESLAPEALYGFPGEVVRAIAPQTESHPAAILVSFLIGAGLLIGRGPYVYRDGHEHYPNEFAILLGRTSGGRKGTASRRADEVFKCILNSNYTELSTYDMRERESLYETLKLSGLGSGEALIEALADENEDRRRLVFEEEFSRPLKVMRREGSVLSETLRQAWDGSVLANRVKGKKLIARGAHVCVLGHITEDELTNELSAVNVFNGFGNRFLWIYTKRSNRLPFGGGRVQTAPLARKLMETLRFCRGLGHMEFDEDTKRVWDQGQLYDLLIDRPAGLLGAITSRADSHVSRLALLYACLDTERVIRLPHLLAGLAVWDYSEQTCRYLFGSSTGNEMADTILELLTEAHPGYLTRTEFRDHFKRNAKPGKMQEALDLLQSLGKAQSVKRPTGERGKPAECWSLKVSDDLDQNDINDLNPLHRARRLVREWNLLLE